MASAAPSSSPRRRPNLVVSVIVQWRLLAWTLPWVAVATAVRGGMWAFNRGLYLTPAATSPVITAAVFVAAQLMAGVLADWKEAERTPSQLVSSLSSALSACLVASARARASPAPALAHIDVMLTAIVDYLDASMSFADLSRVLLDAELGLCEFMSGCGSDVHGVQGVAECKAVLARMEQITATSFVSVAYALLYFCTTVVVVAVLATDFGGHAASLAMLAFFTALFVHLSLLLQDLDSPFTYATRYNRRCLEALAVLPRALHESHASAVDMSLLITFAAELTTRRREVGKG